MRIIAIDPGYERIGIAVLEKDPSTASGTREQLIFSECFKTDAKLPFHDRLVLIGSEIERIITKYAPERMAIEKLFFAKNTKTALGVSEARGVIIYAAKKLGLEVNEFTPNEIKVATTGYGKATKRDITTMLPKLIEIDVADKIDDELDAIAVGITCFAHHRISYPQK